MIDARQVKALSVGNAEMIVTREFLDEEKAKLKDDLADQVFLIDDEQEKLKEAVAIAKEKIKKMVTLLNDLKADIKRGAKQQRETVYLIPDHDKGTMAYYAEDGLLVSERRLLPEEKQTSILQMKNGTEGL